MSYEQAFQVFMVESQDLLVDMEERLLGIEHSEDLSDSLNAIFRAAHTIKGSAGLFGLDPIVAFTHKVESVLDKMRDGELELEDDLINLMLKCKDHIEKLVDSIHEGSVQISAEDQTTENQLADHLSVYLETEKQANDSATASDRANDKTGQSVQEHNGQWQISVKFGENVFRHGMDPLSFLRFLNTIGTISKLTTAQDSLPRAWKMDPESCYLGFEFEFHSDASLSEIESAFEFVIDDCELKIKALKHVDETASATFVAGTVEIEPQSRGLEAQGKPDAPNKNKKVAMKSNQTIRVDAYKLDHLINLIGELVIAGAGVNSEAGETGIASLNEATTTMNLLIEEVRDSVLNLRMVQIGDTFNRFQRIVRDVSRDLNKRIELRISGGDTELDKSVIEKISDPLTHLVRNSVDHGIESAELRAERGKPETGVVSLNAFHESGSIVIEVSDDGGGLHRDVIFDKAVEKGLVGSDEKLSDQEVYRLIFEAGFSTAEQVSNISGRGVGMDVVRRNIESLRGSIEIDSEYTVGTRIRIRLPLTLAIIDGFMLGVGDASYVLPLDIVEECMELRTDEHPDSETRNFINLRGEVLPFIRLRDHFHETGDTSRRQNIVVVKYGNQKAGFVVDQLMGEFQTVIKPMGALFEHLSGISGSTILGSGEVALILDAPALIQKAVNECSGAEILH